MNRDHNQEDLMNNLENSNRNHKTEEITSFLPERFKLDLDTPMEIFLKYAMLAGFVIGSIGFVIHLSGNSGDLKFILGGIFITVISAFLFFTTDNYYIIDTKEKMILYNFKFMTLQSLKDFAPFSSIHATTVNGKRKSTNNRHCTRVWWEHRAEIVLESGKVYPITNWKSSGYAEAISKAKQLAEISGADFVYSSEEAVTSPKRLDTGKYTFESTPYTFFTWIGTFLVKFVIAVAVLFAIAFLRAGI